MDFEPQHNCSLCPRLFTFIQEWRIKEPDWFNGPVPVFSGHDTSKIELLVVGLAPGLRGANRTGRPFTGDYAGDLLYKTLQKHGLSTGDYQSKVSDGVELVKTAIINAVRCVPPQNKPTPLEINTCRQFLTPVFKAYPNLKVVLTLGAIGHQSAIKALGGRLVEHPFKHNSVTKLAGLNIVSSYHCSRYNTNTGVLTEAMFDQVFGTVLALLDE